MGKNDFYYRIMERRADGLDMLVFIRGNGAHFQNENSFTVEAKVIVEPLNPETFMFLWPVEPQFVALISRHY